MKGVDKGGNLRSLAGAGLHTGWMHIHQALGKLHIVSKEGHTV